MNEWLVQLHLEFLKSLLIAVIITRNPFNLLGHKNSHSYWFLFIKTFLYLSAYLPPSSENPSSYPLAHLSCPKPFHCSILNLLRLNFNYFSCSQLSLNLQRSLSYPFCSFLYGREFNEFALFNQILKLRILFRIYLTLSEAYFRARSIEIHELPFRYSKHSHCLFDLLLSMNSFSWMTIIFFSSQNNNGFCW